MENWKGERVSDMCVNGLEGINMVYGVWCGCICCSIPGIG